MFVQSRAARCPGWPGKITPIPDARNCFPESGIFRKYNKFSYFYGHFYEFCKIHASEERKIRQKLGFMMGII